MSYRYMQLGCCQSTCQSTIRIPIYQYCIWIFIQQNLLYFLQHPPSIGTMSSSTNMKIIGRSWNTHFLKEHIRHIDIIMLTSMNYNLLYLNLMHLIPFTNSPRNHCSLDKLRPSTNDGYYLIHNVTLF